MKGYQGDKKESNKKGILYDFLKWDKRINRLEHVKSTGLMRKMNMLSFDFYLKSSLIRCFDPQNNYMSTAKEFINAELNLKTDPNIMDMMMTILPFALKEPLISKHFVKFFTEDDTDTTKF